MKMHFAYTLSVLCCYSCLAMAEGLHWMRLSDPSGARITELAIHPSGAVFAVNADAIFRSQNQGQEWSAVLEADSSDSFTDALATATGEILVGHYFGIALSSDTGRTWQNINFDSLGENRIGIGLPQTMIQTSRGTIFADFYRSRDTGKSWVEYRYPTGAGALNCLGSIDSVIFAGTSNDLYRSTDDGDTWSKVGLPVRSPNVQCISRPNGQNMYLTLYPNGLLRSSDRGEQWEQIRSPLIDSISLTTIIEPQTGVVCAGGRHRGMFSSYDNGNTWRLDSAGLPNTKVRCIAFDPASSTYYAGASPGICTSTDGGVHWQEHSTGLNRVEINSFSNEKDGRIIAGSVSSVFSSSDGGNSWQRSEHGLPFDATLLFSAIDSSRNCYVSAGRTVFRSTDGGIHWGQFLTAPDTVIDVGTMTIDYGSGHIFIATNGGIYRTDDTGRVWQQVAQTYPNGGAVWSIHPGVVLTLGSYCLSRSIDDGATWSCVFGWGRGGYFGTDWVQDPDGAVYLATDNSGVYRSDDYGASWFSFREGIPEKTAGGLGHIWNLAITGAGALFAEIFQFGLYVSADRGRSWKWIDPFPQGQCSILAGTADGYLYAIPTNGGIWRSETSTVVSALSDAENTMYDYILSQNYPNPFNPSTEIRYETAEIGMVTLKIYNLLGQEVAILVNEVKPPGEYRARWSTHGGAGNMPSGVYFYKLTTGKYTSVKKMILMR